MNTELERRIKEKKETIRNIENSSMMDKHKVLEEQKSKLAKLEAQRKN